MLMPIVSMNKMAMNESIAVTCCYRQVPTATAVYWEVLHGGWIGSGYVKERVWRAGVDGSGRAFDYSGMNRTWLELGQDLSGTWDSDISAFVRANTLVYGAAFPTSGGKYWLNAVNAADPFLSLSTAIQTASGGAVGVSADDCDHNNGHCRYRTFIYPYRTNQHFEAKSEHADIDDWADAHDAIQFTS